MFTRIDIFNRSGFTDSASNKLKREIELLDITSVTETCVVQVYIIEGDLSGRDIKEVCDKLLVDNVTRDYLINTPKPSITNHTTETLTVKQRIVEVSRKPGVMDPVEQSALKGINDMGLNVNSVKTATRYLFAGDLTDNQLDTIANKLLANATIEDIYLDESFMIKDGTVFDKCQYTFIKKEIILIDKGDTELIEISKDSMLSLSLHEMKTIQNHFANLKRNPTDIELETIAQTWSEHCGHKTFKGNIEYNGEMIENLLAKTIVKATKDLNKPWCVSVFDDNAGIIEFDDNYNICFKVETHNHPSAIEPYGGASTGIGGVIRDILGTGLGGRPILNTDVFCFGPPDMAQDEIPDGALHPKRVFKGVVAGVRDYGNRMGIPTANGSIFFDKRYIGNPLVFCGTVGLIPTDKCNKEPQNGDLIILAGGRTGRDGIHGVTFASVSLEKDSEIESNSAVQIGNPITEKKLTDVLLEVRDLGLYTCITDCGGGGLSSAIGEMGEKTGVEVYLDKVPLKYQGLSYTEIWISEAQERMIMSVPPENEKEVLSIFAKENVEASTIGRFTDDNNLRLFYNDNCVGTLEMAFLHDGLPKIKRKATWQPVKHEEPSPDITNAGSQSNYGSDLKEILASWNVCSKESIIREYDHEVQGTSVLKPLQGIENDGPGDACVIAPVHGSKKGIIVSNGMNPKYGDIDPYHMAASAIDEALRQIIAVGGNLDQVAILDNFCWGNTEKPNCLGNLVRAAQACHDYSLQYEVPFISGKDSLYNEFEIDTPGPSDEGGKRAISIPHTLLISAVAIMPDVTKAISMDVKKPGNLIYIVGMTNAELGGSHYYSIKGFIGNSVPEVNAERGKKVMESLSKASNLGLIRSCHDCSEGGLAVAAAEMSFAGGFGMDITLANAPVSVNSMPDAFILFSESNSRFIVEIKKENRAQFETVLSGVPSGYLGTVSNGNKFVVKGKNSSVLISENIFDLKRAWQTTLNDFNFKENNEN